MHHNSITMFVRQEVLNDEHLVQTEIITTKWCCSKADKSPRKKTGIMIPCKIIHRGMGPSPVQLDKEFRFNSTQYCNVASVRRKHIHEFCKCNAHKNQKISSAWFETHNSDKPTVRNFFFFLNQIMSFLDN